MTKHDLLAERMQAELPNSLVSIRVEQNEVTAECDVSALIPLLFQLRDSESFAFNQLMDLCAVDYLTYGKYDWITDAATESGFSRGVERQESIAYVLDKPRFAVVYHLLSTIKNHRFRLKVFVEESQLSVPSAHQVWKSANWFEREAYDLFGILFDGHPDLRRILTDYGFIGHPFRKDFPVSGNVEMRYDAALKKVIYVPVDVGPRPLVPKVIRNDNRYLDLQKGEK